MLWSDHLLTLLPPNLCMYAFVVHVVHTRRFRTACLFKTQPVGAVSLRKSNYIVLFISPFSGSHLINAVTLFNCRSILFLILSHFSFPTNPDDVSGSRWRSSLGGGQTQITCRVFGENLINYWQLHVHFFPPLALVWACQRAVLQPLRLPLKMCGGGGMLGLKDINWCGSEGCRQIANVFFFFFLIYAFLVLWNTVNLSLTLFYYGKPRMEVVDRTVLFLI